MTDALCLSLLVGLFAAALAMPFAVGFGYLFARKRFPMRTVLETLLMLPLVVPPVVTGYGLLLLFGKRGFLGPILRVGGLEIAFTGLAAVLAAAVMGFPLAFRACRLAFEGVDPRLEQAARTLGARPWIAFRTVSLPLARGGIIAAAVLAFARSLGEFGATMVFAGNIEGETRTLPLLVYSRMQGLGGMEDAVAPALASVGLALVLLLVGDRLLGRKPE